jgi:hypothetical protein
VFDLLLVEFESVTSLYFDIENLMCKCVYVENLLMLF